MKLAVVYWSGTGNTEMMARAMVEGAKSAGAEVDMFPHTPHVENVVLLEKR